MNLKRYDDSPVQTSISFHPWIEHLKQVAANCQIPGSQRAQDLLMKTAPYPELSRGTTDPSCLSQHTPLITELLADLFPPMLTGNEIKGITIPFQDILLNPTHRLQKILKEAAALSDLAIRGFNHHQFYVNSCCLILNAHYGTNFNFARSLFYDIPDAQGIMKHYRILYNTDFMELTPTARSVDIKPGDIDRLRDNFDDLQLWKKYFPKKSWKYTGFAIMNLFDATAESAVSNLKGTLLRGGYGDDLNNGITEIFRSIFRIPDLEIGFTSFDEAANKFSSPTFDPTLRSYLLRDEEEECIELLQLVQQQKYFVLSDVPCFLQRNPGNVLARRLSDQGIKSIILSPVVKNDHQLGIIELVSSKTGELNSINANQLEVVMPAITDSINKHYSFMQSQVEVLIQNEYTAIHPSVYWKFRKEAQKAFKARIEKTEYTLNEITFNDVMPLYGQTDIKGSSTTRNESVQLDLREQLKCLIPLVENLYADTTDGRTLQKIQYLHTLNIELFEPLKAYTEQLIQNYLDTHIYPLLHTVKGLNASQVHAVANYLMNSEKTGSYHLNRRRYDQTVSRINQKMASLLDVAQLRAQEYYPHYYERFKTDGIEHTMYIGAAIAPTQMYNITRLYNLRLWQLQVVYRMESEYRLLRESLPCPLDVTSLILVYSHQISVRFRMDEKRFDVDGSYNARFEILKKRIDKAFIKDSNQRITAVGKVAIVYSNQEEKSEYLAYIHFLKTKNMFEGEVEMLEVEDLQGVAGLKALRVSISYHNNFPVHDYYTYNDMIQSISAD